MEFFLSKSLDICKKENGIVKYWHWSLCGWYISAEEKVARKLDVSVLDQIRKCEMGAKGALMSCNGSNIVRVVNGNLYYLDPCGNFTRLYIDINVFFSAVWEKIEIISEHDLNIERIRRMICG